MHIQMGCDEEPTIYMDKLTYNICYQLWVNESNKIVSSSRLLCQGCFFLFHPVLYSVRSFNQSFIGTHPKQSKGCADFKGKSKVKRLDQIISQYHWGAKCKVRHSSKEYFVQN